MDVSWQVQQPICKTRLVNAARKQTKIAASLI